MTLRIGDQGQQVGDAQQALVEAGYTISAAELHDAKFSFSTYDAVRAFQAHHVGPDGHALSEDGIIGPNTAWALVHPGEPVNGAFTAPGWVCDLNNIRDDVKQVAKCAYVEVGVREDPDGSNRGPRVDVYTTPDLGIPWCAAFLSWVFAQGCPDGSPFGRLLSAWKLSEWAQGAGRMLPAAAVPQPGDCFIILRANAHGHVGLIVNRADDGSLSTIEGNAGNAVRGLVRRREGVTAIIRPVPLR